ncbi:indolepyruvate ferredoxin oxidoreductase [Allopseudospirillum japonicum]|uniref:Indolepyruvate ferredoxin oxidoreductase n=1 Tax=Allopseudospirillum japonicum TaxID=64971 RepID=A0A1H6Q9D1_9GAMM|nr:indolepyruvate ferredoxin oxidoreductase family protein [Allopseudospirillum japonicum]SEI38456.1 indolepyruvate ferredoxin oxidoreductase [Allopseudospirillum japonicum]
MSSNVHIFDPQTNTIDQAERRQTSAAADLSLLDKYRAQQGRVLLSGVQALVRLPLMQAASDKAQGIETAGFISGYRGSPLGALDKHLWQCKDLLEEAHIHFQLGLNEDLGATSVWGSQQVNLFEKAKYAGVFGLWYGKGPGVDRCGDVFKHANAAGTSAWGGVLAVAGDDHACKSSSLPHQSEFAFMDAMMPVLNPAGIQEILDYGLYGWALSRYSGCWVGLKAIAEQMDASASVSLDTSRVKIRLPTDFVMPEGGLNIRWPDPPIQQEARLHHHKLAAAQAFVRANQLDKTVLTNPDAWLGIVTTGKSWLDLRQAMADLHLDEAHLRSLGVRIYKVAMSWPLEPEGIKTFAQGLRELWVIEEKRPLLEPQIKDILYGLARRPKITGKYDAQGNRQLDSTLELTPVDISRVLAKYLQGRHQDKQIKARLQLLEQETERLKALNTLAHVERTPHFCSGCPHNTSTRVPEGSRAVAGIGCHYMVNWMDRQTATFTHMGGEGVTWIGQAPFTEETHIFQNLGDGTYYHSGSLAIRAAVAAQVNITFKLLYNDAVAMTGGQPVDGPLDVPSLIRQVIAEGVRQVVVVAEDVAAMHALDLPAQVPVYERTELDQVQQDLRQQTGVSVLVYVQTCAAEKRRRRKNGRLAEPSKRFFINEAVCDACGDCSVQSNCLSIIPKPSLFGRKRQIDQSSCNKDYTCAQGFCPSFVSVEVAETRVGNKTQLKIPLDSIPDLPAPHLPLDQEVWRVLVTGVGGTGIVTASALLGMAAHLEQKGVTTLDQTGLAQKFGAVMSHIQIATHQGQLSAPRIALADADVLIGVDQVVASSDEALSRLDVHTSRSVINTQVVMTADFTRQRDASFPAKSMQARIQAASAQYQALNFTQWAQKLLGESTYVNVLMLGYAYQLGCLPVQASSLETAIRINQVDVDLNLAAFYYGRWLAFDPQGLSKLCKQLPVKQPLEAPATLVLDPQTAPLADLVDEYARYLTDYQDAAYAQAYVKAIQAVQDQEAQWPFVSRYTSTPYALTRALAISYVHLLAVKDEYEVARLYSAPAFWQQLAAEFPDYKRVRVHLALPGLRHISTKGVPTKGNFGAWMFKLFPLLAKAKTLRGTPWDVFAYTEEGRQHQHWRHLFEQDMQRLLHETQANNYQYALALAAWPQEVRGFGHVRLQAYQQVSEKRAALWRAFERPQADWVQTGHKLVEVIQRAS